MQYLQNLYTQFYPTQMTYLEQAKNYYHETASKYIDNQQLINGLPIIIPIVVIMSLGDLYTITKKSVYLLLKLLATTLIYLYCIKFVKSANS